ncbi:unnamed protein product [Caenorhabditis nigoni]
MSRFLDIPSIAEDPSAVYNGVSLYVISQLFLETRFFVDSPEYPQNPAEVPHKELIQLMIDYSKQKLRMYGSAEELLENIHVYRSFPGNHATFHTSEVPYQTRPRIFTSLKNDEKYIAKSDLFVILQNMGCSLHKNCMMLRQFTAMIALYLKSKQENIGKCVEFVKFDEKRFEEMHKRMEEEFQKRQPSKDENDQLVMSSQNLDESEFFGKFKRILPSLNEEQIGMLDTILAPVISWHPMKFVRTQLTVAFYSDYEILISIYGSIIDKNPDLFLPRREGSLQPITLRVFEDGDQQFLMKSEVSDVLIANLTIKKRFDDEDDKNTFHTISLEEVLKNFDTKNIEGNSLTKPCGNGGFETEVGSKISNSEVGSRKSEGKNARKSEVGSRKSEFLTSLNEFDESPVPPRESTLERLSSQSSRHVVAQQSPSSHLSHSPNPE